MNAPVKPCSLAAWRLRHAKLTQQEAADRASIPLSHASSIESAPDRATLGALTRYVQACGGKLECFVEIGGIKRLLVLLAMLAIGCADAAPISPAVGPLEQPIEAAQCEVVFSPVPELAEVVGAAAERWSAATGCDIHVGADGIVVRTAPVLVDAATGEHLLGGTHWSPIEVVVDADIGGETLKRTLDHEMGHALVGHPGHASDGLMGDSAPSGAKITAATLTLVCSTLSCGSFNPED